MEKLKIIFVGMPDMALVCLSNLLEKNFNIIAVVPPKKTHETYYFFKNFVLSKNLNLIDFNSSPNEDSCIEKIKNLNADIGVVCSYNYKLSKNFLSSTKMGYINCHPSLLPYYRGASPYFHIINNGEKISGITLHFMDENFDTGDIIYQKKFKLSNFETMGTLFNRTTYMLSDGLIEVLDRIQQKGKIERCPQKKDESFIDAPKVDGNFLIRWKSQSIDKIERLIRACNPFYNAYTTFRGVGFKIIQAKAITKEHNNPFGAIVQADNDNFIVSAKGGYLKIEIAKIGSWGIFSPREIYQIFTPKQGEMLI